MDYGLVVKKQKLKKPEFADTPNLRYVSNQHYVSNGQTFPSLAAVRENKPIKETFGFDPQPVIDTEEFWEESESFYFLTQGQ